LINIQTLTETLIIYFPREQMSDMMTKNVEIRNWGQAIYNKELKDKVMKELNSISLPAKERLINFRKRFPMLENLIPHPYIASYIGISPVSLSRLRKMIK